MKNLLLLAAVSLGFSSCCSMFGGLAPAQYRTETVRTCGYDTVTQEVPVAGSKGGLTQTVTTKVPRFKKVKHVVYCGRCVRYYCPDHDCCGSTGPKVKKLASVSGSMIGSPNLGLVPSMETLAP
ncbi:hypothetical protein [Luteolibacter sp. LG18]|uniref:hypothetical protein n=1 Tax=Luteolibacter sp. LG18 TaxID=2819286 RepID=UPI002B322C9E|nr:hypothetical protein llg_13350 [Luteolibacter sp. LG18]